MSKNSVVIQPGPIFYEVFVGLLKAQGRGVTQWAQQHQLSNTNLKFMATGASNGTKSKEIRRLMIEEIGEDVFHDFYTRRLRNEGWLK